VKQHTTEIVVTSHGPGMIEFTDRVVAWVRATQVATGLLTLHVKHTSASLVIQENADAEVRRDFERFLRRLVPEGDPLFRHTSEGPDDMPAHVRAALTATTLSIRRRAYAGHLAGDLPVRAPHRPPRAKSCGTPHRRVSHWAPAAALS